MLHDRYPMVFSELCITSISGRQSLAAETRFIIGIDLGTTNSAVAYVDTEVGRRVQSFLIPQLVAAGETAAQPLLPSFLYVPGHHELPDGALALS